MQPYRTLWHAHAIAEEDAYHAYIYFFALGTLPTLRWLVQPNGRRMPNTNEMQTITYDQVGIGWLLLQGILSCRL